jgi:hypothetical protein
VKLLARDEARRIAANIAKLLELLASRPRTKGTARTARSVGSTASARLGQRTDGVQDKCDHDDPPHV